jgi:glutamyl-tRNA synthetase/glutamyl-Q tRNA(Asp) synthetase
VVNAIYVWGIARALGGGVLLRLEDHDRQRSRREFEDALLEDLDWLGFVPDAGRVPPLRQSDHLDRYAVALQQLSCAGVVYTCECSRRHIGAERYPGTCRSKGLACAPGRGLRVRMDDGIETFDDGLLGPQQQAPADDSGDVLVRDREGHWTYQFAVAVDDQAEGITLVIRGADLLGSTGRQIRLARMLGRTHPPLFLHHPLVHDESGRKLSKSEGHTGVRELRRAGLAADEVIGRAAAAVGLSAPATAIPASRVHELFGSA